VLALTLDAIGFFSTLLTKDSGVDSARQELRASAFFFKKNFSLPRYAFGPSYLLAGGSRQTAISPEARS
jgi:hypothetical protein